jgi:Kinetochore complex Fta4 of Sim4 subunit, or CENP-50
VLTDYKANLRLRRHNKSVYDSLAIRSIAEQIDSLYWNAAEPENPMFDADNADDDVIRKGDDLTDPRSAVLHIGIKQLTSAGALTDFLRSLRLWMNMQSYIRL